MEEICFVTDAIFCRQPVRRGDIVVRLWIASNSITEGEFDEEKDRDLKPACMKCFTITGNYHVVALFSRGKYLIQS